MQLLCSVCQVIFPLVSVDLYQHLSNAHCRFETFLKRVFAVRGGTSRRGRFHLKIQAKPGIFIDIWESFVPLMQNFKQSRECFFFFIK